MKVAYRPDLVTSVLASELTTAGWELSEDEDPGRRVADGSADIAIGPADGYARHLGLVDYGLIPDFGVTLHGMSGLLRLAFRPGNSDLSRIAVRSSDDFESVAAGIVLIEKHEIEPEFLEVGVDADLESILEKADGVVLGGADAIASTLSSLGGLDLGDEWEDLTESPLPWLLAWGNSTNVGDSEVATFLKARDRMLLSLPDTAASSNTPELYEALHRAHLGGAASFALPRDEAAEVLNPLYHYLFYHGLISDLPTIKFVPPPPEKEAPDQGRATGTVH